MNDCREFEGAIDRVQTREADDTERERLLEHLDVCVGCSERFDLVGRLRLADAVREPSESEFRRLRSSVLKELEGEPISFRRWRPARWPRPALAAAAGLVTLVAGFALGSGWRTATWPGGDTSAVQSELVTRQVRLAAVRHASREELGDSPYQFANVRAVPTAAGRVRLEFDVARHLDLVVDRDDPLLAEALVQTLVEAPEPGARLAAIELTGGRMDARVKRALVIAMREDESLAVRLESQRRLARFGADEEITDSMLEVLEQESAVQMRLVAIDYLTANRIEPERLERALSGDDPATERALYVRAGGYLGRDG